MHEDDGSGFARVDPVVVAMAMVILHETENTDVLCVPINLISRSLWPALETTWTSTNSGSSSWSCPTRGTRSTVGCVMLIPRKFGCFNIMFEKEIEYLGISLSCKLMQLMTQRKRQTDGQTDGQIDREVDGRICEKKVVCFQAAQSRK